MSPFDAHDDYNNARLPLGLVGHLLLERETSPVTRADNITSWLALCLAGDKRSGNDLLTRETKPTINIEA
jgi:hypothetical protein